MAGFFGFVFSEPFVVSEEFMGPLHRAFGSDRIDLSKSYRSPGVLFARARPFGGTVEGDLTVSSNESGSLIGVGSGEIYNSTEIARRLTREGHHLRFQDRFEVVAHLAETRWPDWELSLRGRFVFAVWDSVSRTLLLARDRFGMKPLYWVGDEKGIAFATSLKDLRNLALSLGGAHLAGLPSSWLSSFVSPSGWRLNRASLRWYLSTFSVPSPLAVYEGIQSLEPATRLEWRADKPIERIRYWTPVYRPTRRISTRRAWEDFEAAFLESIRLHLPVGAPCGALLSGGIGSGYVAAQAAMLSRTPVRSYTFRFPDTDGKRLAAARAIATFCGADHREVPLFPPTSEDLANYVSAMDQPLGDWSAWPFWKAFRGLGPEIRSALSGDGCDEVWGGYPYHRLYNLTRWLPKSDRAVHDAFKTPKSLYQNWWNLDPSGEFWSPVLLPEFRGEISIPFAGDSDLEDHERLTLADIEFYLPSVLLPKQNFISGGRSPELGMPWLDPRLFETIAHLPSSLKINGGLTHWLLRRGLAGGRGPNFHPSILHLNAPRENDRVEGWMRKGLADPFQDTALASGSQLEGIMNLRELRRIFEAHRSRDLRAGRFLWAALVLELWLRERRPAL